MTKNCPIKIKFSDLTMKVETISVAILLISFVPQIIDGVKSHDPEVLTSVGTIRGVRATDGDYSKFMGIPYAKVNLSNPFGASLPAPSFDSPFIADDGSIACPQIEEHNQTFYGTLDCLTLNVYMPDSAQSQSPLVPLPVMVYIFGGDYYLGLATDFLIGPKFLVRHDVIFVTINYRVNLYGFMCLHTPEVPGNQGLRDQYDAMKWVKKHISAFGGDPNRITLQGSSSGATSVDLHVLSELEPHFNAVILQSGSAFLDQFLGYDPITPLRVAKVVGLNTTDLREAVAHLATLDVETVVKACEEANIVFKPCVEKKFDGVTRMIASNAVNLKAPKAKDLKVLLGTNTGEVHYLLMPGGIKPSDFVLEMNKLLRKFFSFSPEMFKEATEIIRHFYTGDKDLTRDAVLDMSEFFSDYWFTYPVQRTLRNYLDSGAKEIYYYIFSYLGDRNFHQAKNQFPKSKQTAAYHADELGYLFDMEFISHNNNGEVTTEDQLIIDRMTLMWTNFAKYGDPNPNATDLLPVKWMPITQRDRVYHYVNITTDINVGRRPYNRRMAFWDLFYEAYGQYEKTLNHNLTFEKGYIDYLTNLINSDESNIINNSKVINEHDNNSNEDHNIRKTELKSGTPTISTHLDHHILFVSVCLLAANNFFSQT